jgi:hypothetical protein
MVPELVEGSPGVISYVFLACPLVRNNMETRVGLSPLALFAIEKHRSKKELKQWLNPSREHGITGSTLHP